MIKQLLPTLKIIDAIVRIYKETCDNIYQNIQLTFFLNCYKHYVIILLNLLLVDVLLLLA